MQDIADVAAARVAAAEEILAQAIALEVGCTLDDALTRRFRARPHFLGRTPPAFLVQLRKESWREAARLTDAITEALWDLRIFLGATETAPLLDDEAADARLLADVVGAKLTPALVAMLTEACLPGDDKSDLADVTHVDLDATYDVLYAPSRPLVWAWRNARGADRARNVLVDTPPGTRPEPTFEWRYYLPEASVT